MTALNLTAIKKRFGEVQTIHGIDLEINSGEFVVFVGPSGCGKSTLLRMIAGLETVTEGQVHIGANDVTKLHPSKRKVAMVFQSYALYPHMTAEQNLSFGMKMRKTDKAQIKERVTHAADVLQLGPYLERKPGELSGGQCQRVAIGRALVQDPDVFLFDEPLSNLDAELRVKMRAEIAQLHQRLGATMIYVTHDQTEAMTLADRIVVLRAGNVEQVGAPMALYANPENAFVAGFIGSPKMNFIAAEVTQSAGEQCTVSVAGANFDVAVKRTLEPQEKVQLGVRPEHLQLAENGPLEVKVSVVEQLGAISFVYCELAGQQLCVQTQLKTLPQPGDTVHLQVNEQALYLFDEQELRVNADKDPSVLNAN